MSHHMIQITSSAMVYTSTRGENKNELVVKTGSLLVFIRDKKKKKKSGALQHLQLRRKERRRGHICCNTLNVILYFLDKNQFCMSQCLGRRTKNTKTYKHRYNFTSEKL